MIRLVTGASWVDVEAILDHQVSDTTLRARRDEWIHAGVSEQLKAEAPAAFDRIVGLDLDGVALDGSLHKAPYGGEGTGANPTDRAKLGWKWSVASPRVTAYRWAGRFGVVAPARRSGVGGLVAKQVIGIPSASVIGNWAPECGRSSRMISRIPFVQPVRMPPVSSATQAPSRTSPSGSMAQVQADQHMLVAATRSGSALRLVHR